MHTVGSRIRLLREKKGMTRKQLADKAGYVREDPLYKIETGSGTPKAATLARIAAALDTTVEALTGLDAQPNRQPSTMPPASAEEFAELLPSGAPEHAREMARSLWEMAAAAAKRDVSKEED